MFCNIKYYYSKYSYYNKPESKQIFLKSFCILIRNLYLTHIPKHNIKRNSNWKENYKSWYYMCNIKRY